MIMRKALKYPVAFALVALAASAFAANRPSAKKEAAKKEAIAIEPRIVPQPVPPPPRPPRPGFSVDIWTDRDVYQVGDLIRVYFRVTRPCYVYIFDTDTRGLTRQIFPNYFDPDNYVYAGRRYFIPDATYRLRITGPPGTEELRIVAVRRRAVIYERRHRFVPQNPFPVCPEGAKGFLKEYQREHKYEMRKRPERRSEPSRSKGRIEIGNRRPEAIAVEPVVPPPRTIVIEEPAVVYEREWAEAYTSFRVVDPYYRPRPSFYGWIEVDSRPQGARVYIDDAFRGFTPLVVRYLEPGYHSVEISKPGYRTWIEDVQVREGRATVLNVRLRPRGPRFFLNFNLDF